jgi:hypothetical protein
MTLRTRPSASAIGLYPLVDGSVNDLQDPGVEYALLIWPLPQGIEVASGLPGKRATSQQTEAVDELDNEAGVQ